MKFRTTIVALLFLAVTGIVRSTYGQVTTAAIHGTVTDPAGAVIPNVDITVLNTSNGIAVATKSDGSGFFRVTHLQIVAVHNFSGDSGFFESSPKVESSSMLMMVGKLMRSYL